MHMQMLFKRKSMDSQFRKLKVVELWTNTGLNLRRKNGCISPWLVHCKQAMQAQLKLFFFYTVLSKLRTLDLIPLILIA